MGHPTTWWFQMRDPARLRPRRSQRPGLRLVEVEEAAGAFAKLLYAEVGGPHEWTDRLPWSATDWEQWLGRPEVGFWVLYERGAPAGYFQLEADRAGGVEIAYLGLLAAYRGRGLGGHLLTHAVERAWAWPAAQRVWLHTCSLDSPHARGNYTARGFALYRTS